MCGCFFHHIAWGQSFLLHVRARGFVRDVKLNHQAAGLSNRIFSYRMLKKIGAHGAPECTHDPTEWKFKRLFHCMGWHVLHHMTTLNCSQDCVAVYETAESRTTSRLTYYHIQG